MSSIFQKLQATVKFFQKFSVEEVEFIIKTAPRKLYSKDEYVYRHGSSGNEMYIILNGRARIQEFSDGVIFDERTVVSGDIFGITSFILNKPRTEDALIKDDKTSVIIINDYHITRNLSFAFKLYRLLAAEMSYEVRVTSSKIASYKFDSDVNRVRNKRILDISQSKSPDFSNLVLSKNNFINHTFPNNNFKSASFSRSELTSVTLNRCDADLSNFNNVTLDASEFRSCTFNSANISGSKFKKINFVKCNFSGASFTNSELSSIELTSDKSA